MFTVCLSLCLCQPLPPFNGNFLRGLFTVNTLYLSWALRITCASSGNIFHIAPVNTPVAQACKMSVRIDALELSEVLQQSKCKL